MGLDMGGIGFSFSAQDKGLKRTLGYTESLIAGITESASTLAATATEAMSPVEGLAGALTDVGETGTSVLDSLIESTSDLGVEVEDLIKPTETYKSLVDDLLGPTTQLTDATTASKDGIEDFAHVLSDVVGTSAEDAQKALDRMTASPAQRALSGLKDTAKSAFETISPLASRAAKAISTSFSGALAMGGALVSKATETARSGLSTLKEKASEAAPSITEGFKSASDSLLGLGASAFASMRGLGRFGSTSSELFGRLTDKIAHMGQAFTEALGQRAIAKITKAVDGIKEAGEHAMSSFSEFTGTPRELTSGWEAEQQHHAEAARKIGVNYGFLGKELKQFTRQSAGMADSLNISDEAAAQAVRGFKEATSEFRAVGLTSASLVAKFSDVTGVSADTLRNSLLQARNEFGFADDDLRTLTNSTVAFGRSSGDVTAALNNLPQLLGQVRQMAAQTGAAMDPKSLAKYTAGVNAAALAFFDVSQNSDDARQGAMELSTALLNAQREQGDLFAGNADDIAKLASNLSIGTGDITKSFELMNSGPEGFMEGLARMVQSARKAGHGGEQAMNLLRSNLDQALGPEATNRLMTFVTGAKDATLAQLASGKAVTQDLAKMAKEGFSTRRTTAENFQRMTDSFVSGFRSIGRGAVSTFMSETSKAFGQFNKQMREIVKEGGPLGAIVTKMSEVHQLGAVAFLPPNMRGFATAMGTMVQSMTPTIDVLHKLGFNLSSLASPLTLIGAPLAALALRFGQVFMQTKDVDKALGAVFADVDKYGNMIVDFVARAVPMVEKIVPKVLAVLGKLAVKIAPILVDVVGSLISSLSKLGVELLGYLKTVDWGRVLKVVFTGLETALSLAAPLATALVGTLFDILSQAFDSPGQISAVFSSLIGVAQSVLGALVKAFQSIDFASVGKFVGSFLNSIAKAFQSIDFGSIMGTVLAMTTSLLEGMVDVVMNAAPMVVDAVVFLITGAIDTLGHFAKFLKTSQFLPGVLNLITGVIEKVIDFATESLLPAVVDLIGVIGDRLPGILSDLLDVTINLLTQLPGKLGPLLERLLTKVGAFAAQALPKLLNTIEKLVMSIPGLVMKAIQALPAVMAAIGPMLGRVADGVKNLVVGIFDGIRNWLMEKFPAAAGVLGFFFNTVKGIVTTTIDVIKGAVMGLWNGLTFVVGALVDVVKGVVSLATDAYRFIAEKATLMWVWIRDNVIAPLGDAWTAVTGSLKETFGPTIDWVQDKFQGFIDWATGAIETVSTAIHGVLDAIGLANNAAGAGVGAMKALQQITKLSADEQLASLQKQAPLVQKALLASGKLAPEVVAAFNKAGNSATLAMGKVAESTHATTSALASSATQTAQAHATATQTVAKQAEASAAATKTQLDQAFSGGLPGADAFRAKLGTTFDALPASATTSLTQTAVTAQTKFLEIDTTAQQTAVAVKTAFTDMITSIQTQFTALMASTTGEAGFFGKLTVESTTLFDQVAASTAVALASVLESFSSAVEGIAASTSSMLQNGLSQGIATGMAAGLIVALQLTEKTFIPRELQLFKSLTDQIKTMFARMLVDLIRATDVAFGFLESEAKRLSSVEARFAAVAAARVAASGAQAISEPYDVRGRIGGKAEADNNDLLEAIDRPDWYDDFRKLFVSKMDSVAAEIRSGPRAPTGGRGGQQTAAGASSSVNRILGQTLGSRVAVSPEGNPPTGR